ncbi:MAG: RIP metalloprotease RseP [Curvibacter sp.]|jgi:regulator of sigma E protease|nr:RIP metalloprotease RseP [Curvibacter sp.]
MLTVLAFILALGLLIAVHEYGHYRMAVACGVKVLRFSIGFGHTLLRWQPKGSPTEFVVGAFPLGGYVRMLDEREAPVDPAERHLAFNTQPLRARALIVAAGPMANLVLAVLLYAAVNWGGAEMAAPILGRPVPGSVAQQAGLVGGERVAQAGFEGESLEPVLAYEDLRWLLTRGALEGRDVRLVLQDERGRSGAEHVLPLSRLDAKDADARLFEQIGIVAPFSRPEIGEITPDGAAARSDLRTGDLVLSVDAQPMRDSRELRERIRAAVLEGQAVTMLWRVERAGQVQAIKVRPDVVEQGGATIGRIGAFVGAAPEMVTVEYGLFEGVWQGVVKTWDVSVLTLRTLGRMVVGEASLKNLSGPLTIADYAGRSASLGLSSYLVFLALISVSLGVLNLLPLPVLDGGHLMYYLWEGVTGRPVSEAWLDRLQRAGVFVLALMMFIALFNDVTRLLG